MTNTYPNLYPLAKALSAKLRFVPRVEGGRIFQIPRFQGLETMPGRVFGEALLLFVGAPFEEGTPEKDRDALFYESNVGTPEVMSRFVHLIGELAIFDVEDAKIPPWLSALMSDPTMDFGQLLHDQLRPFFVQSVCRKLWRKHRPESTEQGMRMDLTVENGELTMEVGFHSESPWARVKPHRIRLESSFGKLPQDRSWSVSLAEFSRAFRSESDKVKTLFDQAMAWVEVVTQSDATESVVEPPAPPYYARYFEMSREEAEYLWEVRRIMEDKGVSLRNQMVRVFSGSKAGQFAVEVRDSTHIGIFGGTYQVTFLNCPQLFTMVEIDEHGVRRENGTQRPARCLNRNSKNEWAMTLGVEIPHSMMKEWALQAGYSRVSDFEPELTFNFRLVSEKGEMLRWSCEVDHQPTRTRLFLTGREENRPAVVFNGHTVRAIR